MLGQPILYVPLSGSRVLSVAAPCQVARRFAARAVLAAQRLTRPGGSRVPGLQLDCSAAGPPPSAGARAHRRRGRRRARSSCSGSRACSPTSPRRWWSPSCRCTSSYVGGFRRWPSGSSTASTTAPRRWSAWPAASSATASAATRRSRRVGYGLSAICKLLLATVGTALSAIGATVLIDRIGKGIRTAPRDAMISLSTPERQLGAAFGVHRALDTTGAMIGPLLAFGAAGARAAGLRLDLPRQLLHRAHRARHPRAARPAQAGARRRRRAVAARALAARGRRAARPAALPRAAGRRRRARAWPRRATPSSSSPCRTSSTSATRCSRCSSWAARSPTWCSRCRWASSPTASAAAACSSAATRCSSRSTPRCCRR